MPPKNKKKAQQAAKKRSQVEEAEEGAASLNDAQLAESETLIPEPELSGTGVLVGAWDTEVLRRTNHYKVDGATISIKIGGAEDGQTYQVSKLLLANKLPEFDQMMTSYVSEPVITVHHDVRDFEDFLWFLHADPVNFIRYTKSCPAAERFRRALGIGIIANFYNAASIKRWVMDELSERVNSYVQPELLPRLHRLAEDCRTEYPTFNAAVRLAWLFTIRSTPDTVPALLAAKEVESQDLQAYAYAYILRKRSNEIASDPRLTTLDRIRLTLGSLSLQPYPCCCSTQQLRDYCACVQSAYDGRTLWDLFTRSEMGFTLADNAVDLSVLALSASSRHVNDQVEPLPSPQLPPLTPAADKPCIVM